MDETLERLDALDPDTLARLAETGPGRDAVIVRALGERDRARLARVLDGSDGGREAGLLIAARLLTAGHTPDMDSVAEALAALDGPGAAGGALAVAAYLEWVLGDESAAMGAAQRASQAEPDLPMPMTVISYIRGGMRPVWAEED